MNALVHLLANLVVGLVLYYFGILPDLNTLAIFVFFGIAIDLDHILHSIFRHRTLFPKTWITFMKEYRAHMEPHLYVFHSVEFNVALAVLALFRPLVALLLLSNIIHIILDLIEHHRYGKGFECIKKWSVIHFLIRSCKNRRKAFK